MEYRSRSTHWVAWEGPGSAGPGCSVSSTATTRDDPDCRSSVPAGSSHCSRPKGVHHTDWRPQATIAWGTFVIATCNSRSGALQGSKPRRTRCGSSAPVPTTHQASSSSVSAQPPGSHTVRAASWSTSTPTQATSSVTRHTAQRPSSSSATGRWGLSRAPNTRPSAYARWSRVSGGGLSLIGRRRPGRWPLQRAMTYSPRGCSRTSHTPSPWLEADCQRRPTRCRRPVSGS
jgi:hypothetical protein